MFLDESGDHSLNKVDQSYPMFVLAGCIFDLEYYNKVAEPQINTLKTKYFKRTDIVLRSYDIRKQKNDFSTLVDYKTRVNFLDDLSSLLTGLEFNLVAAGINKLNLIDHYNQPSNPYDLCFQFILERAVMYLGRSTDQLILRAESRETYNDKNLAQVYENFRNNGNGSFIKPEEVQRKLIDLSFNQKTQNVAGNQVSDLVAYPIGKWILDRNKENKPFEIVKQKFHKKNSAYINYGLKIFP